MSFILLLLVICVNFWDCGAGSRSEIPRDSYTKEIEKWRKQRLDSLTAPDGWLSLSGLFWLQAGDNTLGSSPENDMVYDYPGVPRHLGTFRYLDGKVLFITSPEVEITHKDQTVRTILMEDDHAGSPTRLSWHRTTWNLIRRGSRLGLRLRQLNHPRIRQLREIPVYPVDLKWRVSARFHSFTPPRSFQILSAVGTVEETLSPGRLQFYLKDKSLNLVVFPGGPDHFFLVMADLTSGKETYGGGRFLLIPRPGEDGTTTIDFNRAFNPPCVFTEYATCPMPIKENRLPVAITAGEKVPDIDH
jgi:uncharacterized protein (DUF1684 family)